MNTTTAEASDDGIVRHSDFHHMIKVDACLHHGLGLGMVRKAVEQETLAQSGSLIRSFTSPMMISSDTSPPASITVLACRPSSVCALTAARSISPVEIWGIPYFSVMNWAWFFLPGAGSAQQN